MSLESIRERATRATPGPWDWEGGPVNRLGSEFDEVIEPVYRDTRCLVSVGTADAAFIAHARQDIPALLRVASTAKAASLFIEHDVTCPCWVTLKAEDCDCGAQEAMVALDKALAELEALP